MVEESGVPDLAAALRAKLRLLRDHRHAMTYPEHHKLEKVKHQSQAIGEFLDRSGYQICDLACTRCGTILTGPCRDPEADEPCRPGTGDEHRGEYAPVRQSIDRILAGYFEIDLAKLDQEKRAMLAEIRRQNQADNGN